MANVEELLIKLTADNADLKKKLGESEKGLSQFSGAVNKLGPMIAGAFSVAAIGAFAKASYKAFEDQEKANRRLMFAVQGSTKAFKDLTDQASRIQTNTGIADDAIQQIQMLAAQSGKTTIEIKKITEATVQLSAATGQDLQSAYLQINGTLAGSAGRLTRLDKDFGNLTESQLKNGDAIDLILKKYSGFAESSATVTEKMTANWDEFKEKVGGWLAKVFNPQLEKMNTLMGGGKTTTLAGGGTSKTVYEYGKYVTEYDLSGMLSQNRQYESSQDVLNRVLANAEKINKELAAAEEKRLKTVKELAQAAKDYAEEYDMLMTLETQKRDQIGQFDVPIAGRWDIQGQGGDVASVTGKGITQKTSLKRGMVKGESPLAATIKLENTLLEKQRDLYLNIGRAMSGLGELAAMAFGEQSAAYKAFAIGEAIISTYLAASAAVAPPPMGYGPVAGIPAAVGIVAAGLANVAKISGAFAQGGIVGGASFQGDNVTARVNSGEMILNSQQQAALFALANGGGGGGGRVQVYGKLKAGDIYISNNRGGYLKKRRG